jgi:hypothetical protein
MRRLPLILAALLLLARSAPALAGSAGLSVPRAVHAGQWLELRWADLPAGTREVELELSLDGGRWLRISPELEARDGHFRWQVPATVSVHARLRLRAGGDGFEDEFGSSAEFTIEAREQSLARAAHGADWWQVGEHTSAHGWRATPRGPSLADERPASVAERDTRAHDAAPVLTASAVSFERAVRVTAIGSAACQARPARLHPLRL